MSQKRREWLNAISVAGILIPASVGLTSPLLAEAQEVRGTVRVERSGEPISTALVQLHDRTDTRVARSVTDPGGRFVLRAPARGTYRLSVERIGFATTMTPWFNITEGEVVSRDVVVGVEPVTLAGISVEAQQRCERQKNASIDVQRLWDEVRKMLQTVALIDESRPIRFRGVRWERDLDPKRGTVRAETLRPVIAFQAEPFRSLPASDLLSDGFVRDEADSTAYYAPDARVLLSDEFLEAYCFRAVDGGAERVGLAFQPVRRDARNPGIQGVLWLDRTPLALRRIEFTYTSIPSAGDLTRTGGDVEFARLENGTWVVSNWRLRMPRFAIVNGVQTRTIALVHESGGAIRQATLPAMTPIAAAATVIGRVVRPSGEPVAGVLVYLDGTGYADTTRSDGTFRLTSVTQGRYVLGWLEGDDVAGERADGREISMAARDTSIVIRVEQRPRRVSDSCPRHLRPAGTGVVLGLTLSARGLPLSSATVRLSDSTGRISYASTDEAGRFQFCDAIHGSRLTLETNGLSTERTVYLREGQVMRIRLRAGSDD